MRVLPTLLLTLTLGSLAACSSAPAADVQAEEITLRIVGMTCAVSCPPRVEAALESVAGVAAAEVDYDTRTARVHCTGACDREALVAALLKQGFGVAPQ